MYRKFFAAMLAAVFCMAFTAAVQAGSIFITSNGTVEMQDSGTRPLTDIKTLEDGGRVFTNQWSGGITDGIPDVGSEIRTVSVQLFNEAINGSNTRAELPDGSQLLIVSALRGEIIPGPPGTALFTDARGYALPELSGYDARDPETWVDDNGEPRADVFAEWDLAEVQPWVAGDPVGSAVGFSEAQVNKSAVNAIAAQQKGQGQFLLVEDSTDAQNAGDPGTPGTGGDPAESGDNFIRDVEDNSPAGLVKTEEGIGSEISQTIEGISVDGNGDFEFLDDTDRGVLNDFATTAFGGDWATGIGGPATSDFTPEFNDDDVSQTGDFRGQLGGTAHIGHYAVPEPSSFTLLALGLGAAGGGAIRRRRKNRAADDDA